MTLARTNFTIWDATFLDVEHEAVILRLTEAGHRLDLMSIGERDHMQRHRVAGDIVDRGYVKRVHEFEKRYYKGEGNAKRPDVRRVAAFCRVRRATDEDYIKLPVLPRVEPAPSAREIADRRAELESSPPSSLHAPKRRRIIGGDRDGEMIEPDPLDDL